MRIKLDTLPVEKSEELDLSEENNIKYEVNEKWFSLYNWISFSELRQTVMIDYLSFLSVITIPFAILFIVVGVINFYMFKEGNIISFWFLYVLLWGYAIVFSLVILKMIYRAWVFLKVNNVFFTDTHISVGWEITNLNEYDTIRKDINYYGELFHEKLGKKNTILSKMDELKNKVFHKDTKWSIFDDISTDGLSGLWKEAAWLAVVIFLLVIAYWISLYLFYYLGYIISWILSYIFVGIMMLVKSIFTSKEERINKTFLQMNQACKELKENQETALGYIIQNLNWNFTNKSKTLVSSLDQTLNSVSNGLGLSKKLYKQLLDSEYSDAFNFTTFHNWVNYQITVPTQKMLQLLIESNEKVDKQITQINKKLVDQSDTNQIAAYELQLERLRMVRSDLNVQIISWTNMLETLETEVFKKLHK